jgi:putative serine protease PepD
MSTPPPDDPSSSLPAGADSPTPPAGATLAREHRHSTGLLIACALVAALVGAVVGGLVAHLADTSGTTSAAAGSGAVCDARTVAATVLPSVVTIAVRGTQESGSGSGAVIRDSGYVLTNDHVIAAGASGGRIDILFSDGTSRQATITGRSPQLDLAVLKVETAEPLRVITLGDSDGLVVGQPVIALGAPLGLDGSVTAGIISALGRDIVVPADGGLTARIPGGVQTDASINPGNSGGALVDCTGALVGVNTAIATVPNANGDAGGGSVGIGFAIPTALASVVADQLIAHGRFSPPTTGISTIPITAAMARQFGVQPGLYVRDLAQAGPGATAGLAVGDIIVSIEGAPANHGDALVEATLTRQAGDTLTLDYVRDGVAGTASITLAAGS